MSAAGSAPEEFILPTGAIFIRNAGECVWSDEYDTSIAADGTLLAALEKCIREFTDRTGLNFDTVWYATCACPVSKEQTAIRSNVDLIIHLHRAGFLDLTGKQFPITFRYRREEEGWEESFTKAVSTPIRPLFHVWCNKGKPIVIPPQMLEFAKICLKFEYDDCCDEWNSDYCLTSCRDWKYQFHGEKVLFNPTA